MTLETTRMQADIVGTEAADTLEWHERRLALPFRFGEWPLWTAHFAGLSAHPDPFTTTPIADPGAPAATLGARRHSAAFIYSCPTVTELPILQVRGGWLRYVVSQYPHYSVDVSGSFDTYLQSFRGKTLSTLRRKIRRAGDTNERQPLTVRYDTAAAFGEFFELAGPISRQSYQQRLFGTGLPETAAFRREIAAKADRGDIMGFILFLHDQPAAYTLCPRTAPGVVLYDHTGYDPACEQWSPGTVLQYAIIEALFADPKTRTYDLCTGGGRHKDLFATGNQPCANIYFLRILSWPMPVALAHRAVLQMSALAKSALERLRLRDRVKKLMRRYA